MLTSSNQYLRPDYLTPPTALDAKNSPLALLAQTCSAIGADTPNPKLLANIEKSAKSFKSEKVSPVGSQSSSVSTGSMEHQQIKSSFKPYESNNNHLRDMTSMETTNYVNNGEGNNLNAKTNARVKTPKMSGNAAITNGHQQQQQQRCDSNQSATSQRDSPLSISTGQIMRSNSANGMRKTPSSTSITNHHSNSHDADPQRNPSPHRASSKESANSSCTPAAQCSPSSGNASLRLQNASDAAVAAAKEANYVKALHAAAAAQAAGMPPTSSASGSTPSATYYTGYPPGMQYPMDLMTASALMSPHHPMFKAAALNPYLNYARLKGIDPSTILHPICRDPYCTGCPSSPHFLNKAAGQACPPGCPHCESQSSKSTSSVAAAAAAAAAAASSPYQSHSSAAAAAYAHAQLAALAAASHLPYVCSWIAGDAAYCGKRFSTSDELFQHLRTHTASMPDSMLSAAAAGLPPNHPLFQRTYPTPPLSPLSTASRYHPYGKPSMLPPSLGPPGSLSSLQMPPHPSLAQYFSPYSLYGPRLGSSHP